LESNAHAGGLNFSAPGQGFRPWVLEIEGVRRPRMWAARWPETYPQSLEEAADGCELKKASTKKSPAVAPG